MQVKVFGNTIQSEINEWLDENNPKIKFITQSQCPDQYGNVDMTLCIWYE